MFSGVVAQAGWLEAVANPIRLRIVRHLSECESASLDELSKAVSAQRNTVRAHLRALMGAGVVARLPGQSDGRLGRPPARYRLERRDSPRAGQAPAGDGAPAGRSPVSVIIRDYPGGVPAWTLRTPEWAAAVYLLESPWLSASRARGASEAHRLRAARDRLGRARARGAYLGARGTPAARRGTRAVRRRAARRRDGGGALAGSRAARPRAGRDLPGRGRCPRRGGRRSGAQVAVGLARRRCRARLGLEGRVEGAGRGPVPAVSLGARHARAS